MTDLPIFWIALIVVVFMFLVKRYRDRHRASNGATRGGIDLEGDLLRACHGDRAMAERLVAHELERNGSLSRTGAALMALAKLRDDQR